MFCNWGTCLARTGRGLLRVPNARIVLRRAFDCFPFAVLLHKASIPKRGGFFTLFQHVGRELVYEGETRKICLLRVPNASIVLRRAFDCFPSGVHKASIPKRGGFFTHTYFNMSAVNSYTRAKRGKYVNIFAEEFFCFKGHIHTIQFSLNFEPYSFFFFHPT